MLRSPTAAWFIRHGQSTANVGKPTHTPTDTELSQWGRQQAAEIELPGKPHLIVHSRYIRTRQTAFPTMSRYPAAPVVEWPVEEFTFLNPARYLNTTQEQRVPFSEEYFERNDPHYCDGGDSESFYAFLSRVSATLDKLKGHTECPIAIFTHARFIQGLRWVASGQAGTPREFIHWATKFPVANASITTLTKDGLFL